MEETTRKEFYAKVCGEAGANYDFDDEPRRYMALYRDEGAGEHGFVIQTFDTIPDLKEAHEQGRFAIEAPDLDTNFEPLWMLSSIHDLDEQREMKFFFSLELV